MQPRRIKRVCEIRPEFRDVDALGFVHNSVYFLWFERGRLQILDDAIPMAEALGLNIGVVVVENRCSYLRPARYGDVLKLVTTHKVALPYSGRLEFRHELINPVARAVCAEGFCACSIIDISTGRLARGFSPEILARYESLK